jgi:hypothetical protein
MPRKESMDKFVERRGREAQARLKAKDYPATKDSKGPSRSAWIDNAAGGKMKREK